MIYFDDTKQFLFGLKNYEASRAACDACGYFKADDEDEQVDTVLTSCYNCRYRRWLADSFKCMKGI